jgi:Peptidoglycan-binding protein, CsiV
MLRSIVGSLVVAVVITASAAEPASQVDTRYSVELIVFRPTTPLGVTEDWQSEARTTGHPAVGGSESGESGMEAPAPASAGTINVSPMSPALFKLAGIESGLQRSRSYEVLGHVGWMQLAVPRGSGLAADLSQLKLGAGGLRGTAAVERGRYLYLRLNLSYTPADPPGSLVGTTAATGPVTFTLDQVRRVRNFERHYFDHPAFGVIAMVAPLSGAR